MAQNGFNYHSKRWITIRNNVHKKANFKCELCGEDVDRKGSYNIDHIKPITKDSSNADKYGYSNLRCLCIPCHNKVRTQQNTLKYGYNKQQLESAFDLLSSACPRRQKTNELKEGGDSERTNK